MILIKLDLRILFVVEKGQEYSLSALKGKVVLVVNTASECGLRGQLEGLEKLSQSVNASYPNSFVVLGFPSNHFNQEPRDGDTLQEFCQLQHKVSFLLLGEIGLNGQPIKPKGDDNKTGKSTPKKPTVDGGEALFEWLTNEKAGIFGMKGIKWNFEKFLIGKDGKVKGRWSSLKFPSSLESIILAEVKKEK